MAEVAADEEQDEPTRISLTGRVSRRKLMTATAALLGAGAVASAQSQQTVGGDRFEAGGGPQIPIQTLSAEGTLRELYVAPYADALPPVQATPSVAWTFDEGLLIDAPSDSVSSTSTIRTNLAEFHLALNPGDVTIGSGPALVSTRNGGVELFGGGQPQQQSALGGNVDRLDAANSESGLPGPGGLDNVAGWTKANGLHHQY